MSITSEQRMRRRAAATDSFLRHLVKTLAVVAVGALFAQELPVQASENETAPAPASAWHSGPNGMTLYMFDGDGPGVSRCRDWCRAARPVLQPQPGMPLAPNYSVIERADGVQQLALYGRPLYYYVGDSAPGEARGDEAGGSWHAVPALRSNAWQVAR